MPLDEDKYPGESGRRRFIAGVVGSAALASVGAGGAAALNTATSVGGGGGGPTQYVAIENTDGPAPRGMPVVPVEVTSGGELRGVFPEATTEELGGQQITVAEMDMGGTTYSSAWFQYCGIEQYEGAQPDADADDMLRSASGPGYAWQSDLEGGEVLTVDMFEDYETWGNGIGRDGLGKPASARWRSEAEGAKTIPVQVIRSPEIPKMINGEQGFRDYSNLPGGVRNFIDAATDQGFMAWLNKCTHFCCVPSFKQLEGSTNFGGADGVYCQCHQSVYDPFSPVKKQFIARPRPTE
ncbi:cytochrome B [Halobacteriales archaeon QH_10_67_22]|jgi:Rieske Fe-S protein|nr:MAG: cytochrome B [Halobacteriales archaeon QH_10_67_22]